MDRILESCKRTGAEAVHPGFGFLSENTLFASLLKENDIAFIGPPSAAIKVSELEVRGFGSNTFSVPVEGLLMSPGSSKQGVASAKRLTLHASGKYLQLAGRGKIKIYKLM